MPAAYLMVMLDETPEEESEKTRIEGHDKRTDETKIVGEMA